MSDTVRGAGSDKRSAGSAGWRNVIYCAPKAEQYLTAAVSCIARQLNLLRAVVTYHYTGVESVIKVDKSFITDRSVISSACVTY